MVQAAFQRVADGVFPVTIFQTPVVDFYRKYGAVPCPNNQWVDRTDPEAKERSPWEEGETIMFYPHSFPWPEGLIDINGWAY